jgi:hypothetical protein
MGSTDGDSPKSWAWWLDALEAMRRTYCIPMDAREAMIRADVEDARRKEAAAACKAATVPQPAVGNWWWETRLGPVMKLEAMGDLEAAAACRKRVSLEHREMWWRRSAEESQADDDEWSSDPEARRAGSYRRYWTEGFGGPRATFEDTSKHTSISLSLTF